MHNFRTGVATDFNCGPFFPKWKELFLFSYWIHEEFSKTKEFIIFFCIFFYFYLSLICLQSNYLSIHLLFPYLYFHPEELQSKLRQIQWPNICKDKKKRKLNSSLPPPTETDTEDQPDTKLYWSEEIILLIRIMLLRNERKCSWGYLDTVIKL